MALVSNAAMMYFILKTMSDQLTAVVKMMCRFEMGQHPPVYFTLQESLWAVFGLLRAASFPCGRFCLACCPFVLKYA